MSLPVALGVAEQTAPHPGEAPMGIVSYEGLHSHIKS